MDGDPGWIQRSWGYVLPWLAFLGALIVAIRNAYAAERDRQALRSDLQHRELERQKVQEDLRRSELEREKLELEVKRLRNSPEVVADRRAIYDRLDGLLRRVFVKGDATMDQIGELHEIRHDAEFRFPPEIALEIRELISSAAVMHTSQEIMREGRRAAPQEDWHAVVERNHEALLALTEYHHHMVDTFRPYISP